MVTKETVDNSFRRKDVGPYGELVTATKWDSTIEAWIDMQQRALNSVLPDPHPINFNVQLPPMPQSPTATPPTAQSISDNGVALIMRWERYMRYPYNDPKHATIGYGHLMHRGKVNAEDRAAYPDGISRQDAYELLLRDIGKHAAFINRYVRVPLTQNQYDALASYVFNTGPGHLRAVAGHLNRGNVSGALERMRRPVTQDRIVLKGLITRRAAERALFSRP